MEELMDRAVVGETRSDSGKVDLTAFGGRREVG
jgi:hypothetical protein